MKLKPIVLIQPGTSQPPDNDSPVVVSPSEGSVHDEISWSAMRKTIADACVEVIDEKRRLRTDEILELFGQHPEWECEVTQSLPIATWCLVE